MALRPALRVGSALFHSGASLLFNVGGSKAPSVRPVARLFGSVVSKEHAGPRLVGRVGSALVAGVLLSKATSPLHCMALTKTPAEASLRLSQENLLEGKTAGGTDKHTHASPSDEFADKAIALLGPMMQQVSFGMVMGGCAGYAMKKLLKMVAFACGCFFLAVQGLSYHGYVEVKWAKIQGQIQAKMDLNKDGKVDREDIRHLLKNFFELATYGLPSSAGFAGGFYLGFGWA